jgi:hypothetical protein
MWAGAFWTHSSSGWDGKRSFHCTCTYCFLPSHRRIGFKERIYLLELTKISELKMKCKEASRSLGIVCYLIIFLIAIVLIVTCFLYAILLSKAKCIYLFLRIFN